MQIRAGFDIVYDCAQPTPMLLMLSVHPTRLPDLLTPQTISFSPAIRATDYRDGFGNICTRIVAPVGKLRISAAFTIEDSGRLDEVEPNAVQHSVETLPDEQLVYLLGSRYCETDRLSETAWSLFGNAPVGWGRVAAICDYVHQRIAFGYEYARPTKTAWETFMERTGVCRDFAHLAVAFCRCMNIPARYCTGYLGDIGVPISDAPMDFSAWFEAYLGGRWYTFDARHNRPRIGRILMARGRDATDVAITTMFGASLLHRFTVITYEIRP
jgi:transglutaminase-like putative cysteine protease